MTRARLSRETLPALGGIGYDPASLTAGIVHLGLGNFHRAHMARYTHALIQQDARYRDWGILGGGLLDSDRRLYEALAPQDWLYTLVERDGEGERRDVIGSLCSMILAQPDPLALLDAIASPAIRIVSLTVTERGYCLDPATKRLDLAHPAIVTDLGAPDMPRSAIGIIVEALRRRMATGLPAFTAMSCDNIQHNGDVLKRAVLDLAGQRDARLAEWIAAYARFPNTMVDRITPVTRAEDLDALARETGIRDDAAVFCEPFTQWVVENDFADGRPDWGRVGAQFVRDVTPYEKMKLRLLNATHLAIAAIGQAMGYVHVDETMRDPAIAGYVRGLMERETGPTLDPVPGVDLVQYKQDIIARFANPTIKDTLQRIIDDAPINYLLDPIRDLLARGGDISLLALAVAAWLHGRTDAAASEPEPDERLFGNLAGNPAFVVPIAEWTARMGADDASAWMAMLERAAEADPIVRRPV